VLAGANVATVTATEILKEIKMLPAKERAELESFIRRDASVARLSPADLGRLAGQLAESDDPAEADVIEEKIVAGFYGKV
jgi:hypothetical protein